MNGEGSSRGDLQKLLESIKSSEVVECRIELINQLGELNLTDKSDASSLVKSLTTFWEDSTCLDVTQCMLNKSILHVAAKYSSKDTYECLEELLSLGTKASIWCTQHFNMSFTSTGDSQEEHSSIFFQLVLDSLGFSADNILVLVRSPVLGQKPFMLTVEEFIFNHLKLVKTAISEIKIIRSVASEVLKRAQEILNAAVRLCRAYHEALNSELCGKRTDDDGGSMDSGKIDNGNHVTNITTCTINCLYELGILAATGGGSLVMILNVSWKGLVTLLQLSVEGVAAKIKVTEILLSLISLATDSLRCAAESWSSKLKEDISLTEAKRTYVPVKFYLINAVRILAQYPRQAFAIYKELTLFCLMISTFSISLSNAIHLKASSEALTELLEPTSSLLLYTLLNSGEVEGKSKLQILNWLFTEDDTSTPINPGEMSAHPIISMDRIFSVTCEAMPRTRMLLLGRVVLFCNLLRNSHDLGEEAILGISKKLGWLFDCLTDGNVYSIVLDLNIPLLYGSGSALQLVWQSMFHSVLHALKTFMVVASSSLAWEEVEIFLLGNFLHPHFFLREIVLELWCFFVRHGEIEAVSDIIDKLCSLLKYMISSEPILMPGRAVRQMARSICVLLSYAPRSIIDQIYNSIATEDRSPLSSIMYVMWLVEGFPLNLLSDKVKALATQRIIIRYHCFMETNVKKLCMDNFSRSCTSSVVGGPVYALSSALRCLHISGSEIDAKTLKFTLSLIHGYRSATESLKDTYCKLLNQELAIISSMKHLYASREMDEVVLELQTLFGTSSIDSDSRLYQCKPDLALFMAGLGDMKMVEVEGAPLMSALWEIYHMLLRERHWAFVHSAISSFGYFAAHTSCTQLWRFVPQDAALSFDIGTGNEANEERFMSELKAFLEKEQAVHVVAPCVEQVALLAGEALILKELVRKSLTISPEDSMSDTMDIDDKTQVNKKRKLPDEISEGMTLLHSGLKIMGDGLSQWEQQSDDAMEFQKFSTHLSRLENVISQLASLTERK